MSGELNLHLQGYAQQLTTDLYSLQQAGLMCDLYLQLDLGDCFPIHSCVAIASSKYIATTLNSITSENDLTVSRYVLALEDIKEDTLLKLIMFMYTGAVTVNYEHITEVLAAAEMLQMPDLIEVCQTALIKNTIKAEVDSETSYISLTDNLPPADPPSEYQQKTVKTEPLPENYPEHSLVNEGLNDDDARDEVNSSTNIKTECNDVEHLTEIKSTKEEPNSYRKRKKSIIKRDMSAKIAKKSIDKQELNMKEDQSIPITQGETKDTEDFELLHAKELNVSWNIEHNDEDEQKYDDSQMEEQSSEKGNKLKRKFDPRVLALLKKGKKQLKSKLKELATDLPDNDEMDSAKAKPSLLHEGKENENTTYQCGECQKPFEKKAHLIKHINFKHPIINEHGEQTDLKVINMTPTDVTAMTLTCPVCKMTFKQRSSWVQHLNFKHRIKINIQADGEQNCISADVNPLYSNDQTTSDTIVLHRKDVPPPIINNNKVNKKRPRIDKNCPICHKFFRFKIQYEDHILKHSDPKPYKCQQCEASFRMRGQLKAHVEVHGTVETEYQCSYCPRGFTVKSRLLRHEAKHKDRDRKYVCDMCGKAFMESNVLTMHKKHVHEKTLIKCDICHKEVSSYIFKQHMNLHTGEKLYPCQYCDKVYKQRKSLDCHMKFTHQMAGTQFNCEICGSVFSNNVTLAKHMIRHTGNKSFPCSTCGQTFYTKAECEYHETTHLNPDERPFSCHICNKKFLRHHSLMSHLLVHEPSKPLSCSYCGKGFRWKNKLKEHIRTHTGDTPFQCRYCSLKFTDCAIRRYHEKKFHSDSFNSDKSTNKPIQDIEVEEATNLEIEETQDDLSSVSNEDVKSLILPENSVTFYSKDNGERKYIVTLPDNGEIDFSNTIYINMDSSVNQQIISQDVESNQCENIQGQQNMQLIYSTDDTGNLI